MHEVAHKVVLEVTKIASETVLNLSITVSVEKEVYGSFQDSVEHRVMDFIA